MTPLDTIRARLADHDAEAALLTFLPDIRWAVGFTGSNGVLVVTEAEAHFVTDGRYTVQAGQEVTTARVHVPGYGLADHVVEEGLLGSARRVLVQSDHLTVKALGEWEEKLEGKTFVPVADFLSDAVASKTPAQVEKLRAAQAVTDEVFSHLLPLIGPGVTELDLAAEIVYAHLKRGCSAMAFEPIVASGRRSALPHARPSSKRLEPGDLVTIDMGGVLDGYCSDMTRTVALGPLGEEEQSAYAAVLRAQHAAIAHAKAGMTGKALDTVARDVLDEAGLADYFAHSLGHGLGLQVHEWPSLSQRREHVLPVGAAVTIEPGVYLPERFGLRIEDTIVLREDGCDNLTRSVKELIVIE